MANQTIGRSVRRAIQRGAPDHEINAILQQWLLQKDQQHADLFVNMYNDIFKFNNGQSFADNHKMASDSVQAMTNTLSQIFNLLLGVKHVDD